MNPGDLRHRVQLQELTRTPDAMGGNTLAWTTTATVWARVRPASGGELFRADQQAAQVTHSIRIRYRAGVSAKTRVLYNGRVFDVRSVLNPDERNEYLDLLCYEGE